jgi:hypothetical protein
VPQSAIAKLPTPPPKSDHLGSVFFQGLQDLHHLSAVSPQEELENMGKLKKLWKTGGIPFIALLFF